MATLTDEKFEDTSREVCMKLFGNIAQFVEEYDTNKDIECVITSRHSYGDAGEFRRVEVSKNKNHWFTINLDQLSDTLFNIVIWGDAGEIMDFKYDLNTPIEGGTKEMIRIFYTLKIRGARDWKEHNEMSVTLEELEALEPSLTFTSSKN